LEDGAAVGSAPVFVDEVAALEVVGACAACDAAGCGEAEACVEAAGCGEAAACACATGCGGGGEFAGGGGVGAALVLASSKAANGSLSLSCAGGVVDCSHCDEAMESVALTSDAELGTVDPCGRDDAMICLQPAGQLV
jgi:hypothetical protein